MIKVYFKDGRIFEYKLDCEVKAFEHIDKIRKDGYRSVVGGVLTWYGPHYIDKIKFSPIETCFELTEFPDSVKGS